MSGAKSSGAKCGAAGAGTRIKKIMDLENVDKNLDLPLMANVEEVRVKHYMMRLKFDFAHDVVFGEAVIFCENKADKFREIVLDARHLNVASVWEVSNSEELAKTIIMNFESRIEQIEQSMPISTFVFENQKQNRTQSSRFSQLD